MTNWVKFSETLYKHIEEDSRKKWWILFDLITGSVWYFSIFLGMKLVAEILPRIVNHSELREMCFLFLILFSIRLFRDLMKVYRL